MSSGAARAGLVLKRSLYEDNAVASYWVVDPEEPSLLVLELRDGRYAECARVVGEQVVQVTAPYPATLSPQLLVGKGAAGG